MKQSELLTAHLENAGGVFWDMRRDLAAVKPTPETGRVGVMAERLRIVRSKQAFMRDLHEKFLSGRWAQAEEKRLADNDAVVRTLRSTGKSFARLTDAQLYDMGLYGPGAKATYREAEAGRIAQEAVLLEARTARATHAFESLPTEALLTRATKYLDAAAGELQGFPVTDWAVDQPAIQTVLQQRLADGKDFRARVFVESLRGGSLRDEVEFRAIQQTVGPDLNQQAQFHFDRLTDAIDGMVGVDGGQPVESLQKADAVFAAYGPVRPSLVQGEPVKSVGPSTEIPAGTHARSL